MRQERLNVALYRKSCKREALVGNIWLFMLVEELPQDVFKNGHETNFGIQT